MKEVIAEHDPSFLRAKALLAGTIHTPEYLVNLWNLLPPIQIKYPSIEKVTPWDFGIENLIT